MMNISTRTPTLRPGWPTFLAVMMTLSSTVLLPAGLLAAEPSATAEPATMAEPAATAAASPSATSSADAMCASAADLRLIVQFLRQTDVDEEGWLPILVGAIAGLAEARDLLGFVDATYRPQVATLVTSLEELFSIADELKGLETIGDRIAALGEAITAVGIAMDELSTGLREPCPTSV